MVTLEQALSADTFHFGDCTRTVGPRGGVRVRMVVARRNGRTQTWKRNPDAFRVPVKAGLRDYGAITDTTAHRFHAAAECPLDRVDA